MSRTLTERFHLQEGHLRVWCVSRYKVIKENELYDVSGSICPGPKYLEYRVTPLLLCSTTQWYCLQTRPINTSCAFSVPWSEPRFLRRISFIDTTLYFLLALIFPSPPVSSFLPGPSPFSYPFPGYLLTLTSYKLPNFLPDTSTSSLVPRTSKILPNSCY